MRKIIVSEFMTVDGVFEAPGGEGTLGDRSGWTFPYWSDEQGAFKRDELFAADALLLGRKTYDGFAAAWPTMQRDPAGFADRMNSLPKYVVSSTLGAAGTAGGASWNNTTVIEAAQAAEEIVKLKNQPGQDILVFGSGMLVEMLAGHELIDEYRLMVFPVILGTGMHLFKEAPQKKSLALLKTQSFSSGVVLLTYVPEIKNIEKK